MRKTLIGAVASVALLASLLFGLTWAADAQEATATPEPTATVEVATPTPEPTVDPAATPAPTATTTAEEEGDGTVLGDSFEADTPNPQPSAPLATAAPTTDAATADAAATTGESAATDEVLGESQLAFTGPDTRIIALAILLLAVGAMFVVTGKRQRDRLVFEDSWVE